MADDPDRQAIIRAAIDDIVLSDRVTGTMASWLKESLAAAGFLDDGANAPERDYGSGDPARRWRDIWSAGQGVGSIKRIEPLAAIIDAMEDEFAAGATRVARRTHR